MTVESVDQHREHQALDAALNHAMWALDLAGTMGDVKEGNLAATSRPVILAGMPRLGCSSFSITRGRGARCRRDSDLCRVALAA